MNNYTNYIEVTSDDALCLINKDQIQYIEPRYDNTVKPGSYIHTLGGHCLVVQESYTEIKKALLWPRTNMSIGGKRKDDG